MRTITKTVEEIKRDLRDGKYEVTMGPTRGWVPGAVLEVAIRRGNRWVGRRWVVIK